MIRLAVQRALERGTTPNSATMLLARAWASNARVTRTLETRVPTLCIGGATLGGSGRTPLVIACARHLERSGLRVAIIGHAYGARPSARAHRVSIDDDARIVGDESIECARAGAKVFVARTRQTAIDAAQREADVLVFDGPLQLEPRATLSLLAVDPISPWGSGACPPLGNLRASKRALIEAADAIVSVEPTSRGVRHRGELICFDALAHMRLGLTTGIARPERVLRLLRAKGLEPSRVLYSADHAPLRFDDPSVDLWLTLPERRFRRISQSSTTTWTYLRRLRLCCVRASPFVSDILGATETAHICLAEGQDLGGHGEASR